MLGGIHLFTGSLVGASLSSNPISSFFFGIVSHHLLDYLPHFDTNLFGEKGKDIRTWPKEAWFLVVFEFFSFALLLFLFFAQKRDWWLNLFFGGFGGIFPDIFAICFRSLVKTKDRLVQKYLNFHLEKFHFRKPIEQNLSSAILIYYLIFVVDLILVFGLV